MVSYYKTVNNRISRIDNYQPGCWINCVEPEENEINEIIEKFNIEPEFLKASLDKEESSHIDHEGGTTLIIIDTPIVEKHDGHLAYSTMPLSIMITPQNVITISIEDNPIVNEFADGVVRNVYTHFRTQFVFHIMFRMASKYLQYLNQIDKLTYHTERELRKSMKNKELIQLLEIEKSLVYFSTSLKSNNITLEKLLRGKYVKLYDEDQDLLEDVIIEIKQGVEMAEIHINILSSTMDAFASIISNNLNIVMKVLTSITLIMTIPTIVSGIYGMNNRGIPFMDIWWVPFLIMGILMVLAWFILKKKKLL